MLVDMNFEYRWISARPRSHEMTLSLLRKLTCQIATSLFGMFRKGVHLTVDMLPICPNMQPSIGMVMALDATLIEQPDTLLELSSCSGHWFAETCLELRSSHG